MTEENIKVNGRMENNTVMENSSTPENKFGRREFGVKEKELDGLMKMSDKIKLSYF